MSSDVGTSCRAAGISALGVATNKHGKTRKTGEMSILDYDKSKSGVKVTRTRREVRKAVKAGRPHTSPDTGNALRASRSWGSLGDSLRPGAVAHSSQDEASRLQSSNSVGSLGDGVRLGSAANTRPNTGDFAQPLRSFGNGLPAGGAADATLLNNDGLVQNFGAGSVGNLRPVSAANSRPNKPLQPAGSVGSPGSTLQPQGDASHALSSVGGLGSSLRPGSAVNSRPMNGMPMQRSGVLDNLGGSLRPGSAANGQVSKGELLQASVSLGNIADTLRPGSAAGSRPIKSSLGPLESGLRPGSAAQSRFQPSNSLGNFVETSPLGSAENSRPQQQSLNGFRYGDKSNSMKSVSWLEPSQLAAGALKQRSQSELSTATGGSTWKNFGFAGDNEDGTGTRPMGMSPSRRPTSSERRMAPLDKKRPGASVAFGINPMFAPTGSCFPSQIGMTHTCSAFGNVQFKDPPAAGFKYWRDFRGSGGNFIGM